MIDNKLLEQRLILRESVAGSSTSLSKCAAKLSVLKTAPHDLKAVDSFIRELSLYKLDIERSSRCIRSYGDQIQEYDELEASINAKISEASREIEELKEELRQQKDVRAHRQIVEEHASLVNSHQKTSSTKRKIADVQSNIVGVQEALMQVESEMSTRLGQVERLMVMIHDLEEKLHEDENAEGEEAERDDGDRRGGREEVAEAEDGVKDGENNEGEDNATEASAPKEEEMDAGQA